MRFADGNRRPTYTNAFVDAHLIRHLDQPLAHCRRAGYRHPHADIAALADSECHPGWNSYCHPHLASRANRDTYPVANIAPR